MASERETTRQDGYFDKALGTHVVSVMAGAYHWTRAEDVALSTMLGSCVAVCVCDTRAGIGGMNHFLLPKAPAGEDTPNSHAYRYGSAAIESMLNALFARGAAKNGLSIKIFGGSKVLNGVSADIGQKNIEFTRRFFQRENLRIDSEDVGGTQARRILFYPKTGKVLLKALGDAKEVQSLAAKEQQVLEQVSKTRGGGDVELF